MAYLLVGSRAAWEAEGRDAALARRPLAGRPAAAAAVAAGSWAARAGVQRPSDLPAKAAACMAH
jgi:hypothetical protein